MRKSLDLPKRRFVGIAEDDYFYITEPYDWAGKLPKSGDIDKLPIAWTPYQLSLYYGELLTNIKYFVPRSWYCQTHTLLRLPKIVMLPISIFSGFLNSDWDAIFNPLKPQLEKNNIAVLKHTVWYESPFRVAFRMFLPHETEETIDDTSDGFGPLDTTLPKVIADHWATGQVLYMDCCETLSQTVGIYSDYAGFTFSKYDNAIKAHVDQIKDCYKCYDKFGYHIAFTNPYAGNDYQNLSKDLLEDIVNNKLAGYNCTMKYFSSNFTTNKTAILTDFRDKVKEFFKLE